MSTLRLQFLFVRFSIPLVVALIFGCSPTTLETLSDRQRALEALELEMLQAKQAASKANSNLATAPSDKTLATEGTPTTNKAASLLARIDATLERELRQRRLSSSTNAAWQIMHGVISYGVALPLETPDRGMVGAVEYAFHGGIINGFELGLGPTPLPQTGRTGVTARLEPGSYVGQGHPDQWLAIFAMADLPADSEVMVGETQRTILDWGRQAQYDVVNNLLNEYSWTLIALTHYFPNEPDWVTANGKSVSWEALVDAELSNDINSSACGGTHRLSGLVRSLSAKRNLGLPDSEIWQQAQTVVDQAIENARLNRSRDGSLSSDYFVRANKSVDLGAELSSSGHLFEFLALALSKEQLAEPWIELSVSRVCDILDATQHVELDCGALYHALNGLKMYRSRRSTEATN